MSDAVYKKGDVVDYVLPCGADRESHVVRITKINNDRFSGVIIKSEDATAIGGTIYGGWVKFIEGKSDTGEAL